MVDPLGLVYGGERGAGAAAILEGDKALDTFTDEVKRKRLQEEKRKGEAVKTFKPLDTPWNIDVPHLSSKKEGLYDLGAKMYSQNPEFIYQPYSKEYQEFYGAYNNLKRDIDLSKKQGARFEELQKMVQQRPKQYDLTNWSQIAKKWSVDTPFDVRKEQFVPDLILKEDYFDITKFESALMSKIKPTDKATQTPTGYGTKIQTVTQYTDEQFAGAAKNAYADDKYKGEIDEIYAEYSPEAIDEVAEQADALSRELQIPITPQEYLAYNRFKNYQYRGEKNQIRNLPSAAFKAKNSADYYTNMLRSIARIVENDPDMFGPKLNSHGYYRAEGAGFMETKLREYTTAEGKRVWEILTGLYSDTKGNVYYSTSKTDAIFNSTKEPKDKYKLVYSKEKGVDNIYSELLIDLVETSSDLNLGGFNTYLNNAGTLGKKNEINWATYLDISPAESLERKQKRDKLTKDREAHKVSVSSSASKMSDWSWFWGRSIKTTDRESIKEINTFMNDMVIEIDGETYKSPQLEIIPTIGGVGNYVVVLKDSEGKEIKRISSKEDLDGILNTSVLKAESNIKGGGAVKGAEPSFTPK